MKVPKNWQEITCKNCGKQAKTRIKTAELCSFDCIREWNQEERYYEIHKDDAEKKKILEDSLR